MVIFILFLVFLVYISYNMLGWFGIIIGILAIVIMLVVSSKKASEKEYIKNENRRSILKGDINGFKPSKEIQSSTTNHAVYVDETQKKILFTNLLTDEIKMFSFDEIIKCEILEDGATILSGGVGRAVVGGIVAGGVGAIVGASTRSSKPTTFSMSIKIITTNVWNALYEIPIITTETKRDSDSYKSCAQFAKEVHATVISAINSTQNK